MESILTIPEFLTEQVQRFPAKKVAMYKNAEVAVWWDLNWTAYYEKLKSAAELLLSLNILLSFWFGITVILIVSVPQYCFSNNINVANVRLTGQNTISDYTHVQFDISWDNSWRTSSGTSNWDAAWVFVKYRLEGETTWNHATLNWADGTGSGDGHTPPPNSNITTSNDNGANGAYGIFIYRNADMAQGSVSYTGTQLRWNYGVDGLIDVDKVELCVFAIEMVYVPQASFYVGSGGTESGAFYTYPTTTNPYQITSEGAITVGTTAGNLYYPNPSTSSGDQTGPIPAAFPKGYNAFYCMKYEITQAQYVAFLNKLTRDQQNTRTATGLAPGTTAVTNRYVMSNNSTLQYRNGIRCDATIHTSDPITFYCDLDGDGTGDETNDGQSIACNYLSWADLAAYLDWTALRPMTELEYEKAARGTLATVANEYAWGSASVTQATGISNAGLTNETSSNGAANCDYGFHASVQGPMRVGNFGQGVNTRVGVGASYYGIMELSGNLWKRCVTVGNATGRAFTGIHGNGIISASGNADASNWPGTDAIGTDMRGGNYSTATSYLRVSDRYFGALTNLSRSNVFGCRGVRVAP
ncbi:MAG: SUMF1/EgtB/PvdO family nonheme iron enzyme [Bacteroidetes bacterium]|nr:SUMF1/EgtB/PvdO family nonheme iron enzyme [Bacteroidota bacterium]